MTLTLLYDYMIGSLGSIPVTLLMHCDNPLHDDDQVILQMKTQLWLVLIHGNIGKFLSVNPHLLIPSPLTLYPLNLHPF
jgi:hypothetical protein